jgi:hypothetical protein
VTICALDVRDAVGRVEDGDAGVARSAKPSSAALPVSPEVATRIRKSSASVPSRLLIETASEKKSGMHCSAMSLNASVGPCQSSSTWMSGRPR